MIYFPYLRGKQYELIALRDICSFATNTEILSPIIEPVKKINTTLTKTLINLKEEGINFNFIFNPQESKGEIQPGDYENYMADVTAILSGYKNYQPAFLINEDVNIPLIIRSITTHRLENISLIITQPPRVEYDFDQLLKATSIKYTILQDDSSVRRLSRKIRPSCANLIFLADRFNIKTPNIKYKDPEDEFFSNDHIFYKEEGYTGFSDYLTIGNSYTDGGFLPYAVAIHLTYFDKENNLRIRHFLSDSNEDNSDIPGKVAEALSKLVPFIDARNMHTIACEQFRNIFQNGLYPGLGSIKKLSMLNHMELLYNFIIKEG